MGVHTVRAHPPYCNTQRNNHRPGTTDRILLMCTRPFAINSIMAPSNKQYDSILERTRCCMISISFRCGVHEKACLLLHRARNFPLLGGSHFLRRRGCAVFLLVRPTRLCRSLLSLILALSPLSARIFLSPLAPPALSLVPPLGRPSAHTNQLLL